MTIQAYCIDSNSAYELASVLIDASLCNDFARKFIVEHLLPMSNCYYDLTDLGEFYANGNESMRARLIALAVEYVNELNEVED